MNLSGLSKVILSSHLWAYFKGNSSHLILPHCQAERRRRLLRHHIWLWGHDPPLGQVPLARLPDPSVAWSGSQSLGAQEMTAKKRQGKKGGDGGAGGEKKIEWDEWHWCLSFNFLLDIVQRQKGAKSRFGHGWGQGWLHWRKKRAVALLWGKKQALIKTRFYFNKCSFVFRHSQRLWSLSLSGRGVSMYAFCHTFFLLWIWPMSPLPAILFKPPRSPFATQTPASFEIWNVVLNNLAFSTPIFSIRIQVRSKKKSEHLLVFGLQTVLKYTSRKYDHTEIAGTRTSVNKIQTLTD